MILRLLLVVMLVFGAAPTLAAPCHDSMRMAGHSMPVDAPGKAMPEHVCFGCIPPSDWLSAPVAIPALTSPVPLHARVARPDLGRILPPALPPPRST